MKGLLGMLGRVTGALLVTAVLAGLCGQGTRSRHSAASDPRSVSRYPSMSAATIGSPAAAASRSEIPKLSPSCEGATKASAAA